jgi:beta-hydroxylase
MSAAAAPNSSEDNTGAINRLFSRIYKVRLRGKAMKKTNRMRYYLETWAVVGLLIGFFIWI